MPLTISGSMPKPWEPIRASPLSFRRPRLYSGDCLFSMFAVGDPTTRHSARSKATHRVAMLRTATVALLLAEHTLDFGLQVRRTLFKPFTHHVARKPSHTNVLADLSDQIRDQLFDRQLIIFYEWLIVEAGVFLKILHLSFEELLHRVVR